MHQKQPPANVALASSCASAATAVKATRLATTASRSNTTDRMDQALLKASARPFMQ